MTGACAPVSSSTEVSRSSPAEPLRPDPVSHLRAGHSVEVVSIPLAPTRSTWRRTSRRDSAAAWCGLRSTSSRTSSRILRRSPQWALRRRTRPAPEHRQHRPPPALERGKSGVAERSLPPGRERYLPSVDAFVQQRDHRETVKLLGQKTRNVVATPGGDRLRGHHRDRGRRALKEGELRSCSSDPHPRKGLHHL
jgi:hypothetical protein